MLENLTKQQKFLAGGVVLVLLVVVLIAWVLIRQKYAEDGRISEPTLEELIESTTAPGGSLLTPEEEQELIESTTAPGGSLLTLEQEQELIESTTVPGN